MRNLVEARIHPLLFRPTSPDQGLLVRAGRDWFSPEIRVLWYPAECVTRGAATHTTLVPYDWGRSLFVGRNGVRYHMTARDWTRPLKDQRIPLPTPPWVAEREHEYRAASWWVKDGDHWVEVL